MIAAFGAREIYAEPCAELADRCVEKIARTSDISSGAGESRVIIEIRTV